MAEGVRAVGSRAELAAILAPDGPLALVDFHAIWCGPCRAMAPAFAATAEACADLPVAFHSVDIDEHPDLAEAFGVRGVPTILVIQGGAVVETRFGAQSARGLRRLVDERLGRRKRDRLRDLLRRS